MEQSKVLGDAIEKVTKATGLKKLVKMMTKDCGCEERRDKLNEKFPYKQ